MRKIAKILISAVIVGFGLVVLVGIFASPGMFEVDKLTRHNGYYMLPSGTPYIRIFNDGTEEWFYAFPESRLKEHRRLATYVTDAKAANFSRKPVKTSSEKAQDKLWLDTFTKTQTERWPGQKWTWWEYQGRYVLYLHMAENDWLHFTLERRYQVLMEIYSKALEALRTRITIDVQPDLNLPHTGLCMGRIEERSVRILLKRK